MSMVFALKNIDRKEHTEFVKYLKEKIKEGKSEKDLEEVIQYKAHELIPSLRQEGHNQRHVLKAVWRKKIMKKSVRKDVVQKMQ